MENKNNKTDISDNQVENKSDNEYDPFGVAKSWPEWAGKYRPFTPHQILILEALAGRK